MGRSLCPGDQSAAPVPAIFPHTLLTDIVPSELGPGTCWREFSRLSLLNRGLCSSSQEEEGEGAGTGTPLSRLQGLSQVSSKTYAETLWLAGMALHGKWQGRLGGPFSTQYPTLPSDCLLSRALLPSVPSSGLTVQTKEWLCTNGALITDTQWPEGMCPDMHAWEEKWYLHTSMDGSVPGYGSVFA